MKIVLILLLAAIIASLFSGLYFMYRKDGNPTSMVNALKIRVALSILAFVIAVGGFALGWFPRT
jgi:hypothetical protein